MTSAQERMVKILEVKKTVELTFAGGRHCPEQLLKDYDSLYLACLTVLRDEAKLILLESQSASGNPVADCYHRSGQTEEQPVYNGELSLYNFLPESESQKREVLKVKLEDWKLVDCFH